MELEIGVVGGEEDGVVGEINEKLYTTPEDALATAEALGLGERGRYILAATFGNVHGVYKPGHVKLRPSVLKEIQDAVGAKYGKDKPFDLVFHGGSGSAESEIREAICYGVVKMNVDTDTQYAFTRPVAGHMFSQLRRRAQGRRRGRQQEGLRPAHLGQVGRGRHGRPGHPGLPGPAVRRHQALLSPDQARRSNDGPEQDPRRAGACSPVNGEARARSGGLAVECTCELRASVRLPGAAVGEERPAALLLVGLADRVARGGAEGGQAAQEAPVGLVRPGDGAVALPAVAAQRVEAAVVAGAGVGVGLDRAAAVQRRLRQQRPGQRERRVLGRDVDRGGARRQRVPRPRRPAAAGWPGARRAGSRDRSCGMSLPDR